MNRKILGRYLLGDTALSVFAFVSARIGPLIKHVRSRNRTRPTRLLALDRLRSSPFSPSPTITLSQDVSLVADTRPAKHYPYQELGRVRRFSTAVGDQG